jgi:hypothetical protein
MAQLFHPRTREQIRLGSTAPVVGLSKAGSLGPGVEWNRHLTIHSANVAWIGNGCDTCGFMFEQRAVPMPIAEMDALRETLATGLVELKQRVIDAIGTLIPEGEYVVALLKCLPIRIEPGQPGDYFFEDLTSAKDRHWLPGEEFFDPYFTTNTPYYRLYGRSGIAVGEDPNGYGGTRYDFVMPLAQTIDPTTVASYRARIDSGGSSTAVSLSVLDIKEVVRGAPHWCMAHYLIDGHHKVAAAAQAQKPLTLLAFFALGEGVCSKEDVLHFLSTY